MRSPSTHGAKKLASGFFHATAFVAALRKTEAVLSMDLYLGTDCRWGGQWNYHGSNRAE